MTTEGSRVEPRKRTPGDTNIQGWGFDLHPQVSFISGGLIILFIVLTLIFKEQAEAAFKAIQSFIADMTGWFLILVANIYLGVVIIFAFSKFGKIRIGGQDAQPEFSNFAWYAMLFSAGMGAGLLFWGIAEPISHFQAPPLGSEAGTAAAAEEAMGITYFHWGLHGWGIYTLVGLSLAFFAFNRGLPLTIRSVFYPLLGEKIYEWPGNLIDILAVLATLFGLATSLGFGAQQVNAGLNFLVGLPDNVVVQVFLIAIITGFATLSVVAGLDGGVRRLSEWNIYIAIAFFAFMLLIGPTQFILDFFVQSLGYYIGIFPTLSFWTEAFEGTNWQNSWTIFYWAWWIAWSPFVGMFIARVSKGRTVREFVLAVLFLPSFLSFIWMSCFGGSALSLALKDIGNMPEAVQENMATGLFVMLQQFPITSLSSLIGLVLVITFFVTSSDSGSLVVDHLTSGGKLDSPVPQRIFWAAMEGLVAAVLLLGGGLSALQTAATTTGLPFAIVLLVMCFSLHRGLTEDWAELEAKQLRTMEARRGVSPTMPIEK
ncbi:MAG: BCCT family transporter [Symploca sp. SIO2C1]|nr:BCCT family transporter [Symploca sp. SIO2C1]